MIVRSPSEKLRRLMRVFDPMVEEIIIIFTTPGKETDVMRDLKTNARCCCLYHPLYDDFSKVRNIAIQNATQPWIFVIDDDEWIEPCDLVHLKRFACSGDADAYCFVRYDYYTPGGWGIKLPCRLFRNIPSIRYEGPIYEEIIPSLHPREQTIKIIWDQCPIYHRRPLIFSLNPSKMFKDLKVRHYF